MIVVLSQGCAANFGDGEKIARVLSQKFEVSFEFPEPHKATSAANSASKTPANFEQINSARTTNAEHSANDANLEESSPPAEHLSEMPEAFFLNVCTVKGNAGAMKLLRKASSTYPGVPIYITGCAPKDFREEAIRAVPQVQFTTLAELEKDPLSIFDLGNATQDRTRKSNKNSTRNESRIRPTNVLRESPFIGIVNIEEGCLDACAFCSTHLVKGRLGARPSLSGPAPPPPAD